jgi:hypothetical protein
VNSLDEYLNKTLNPCGHSSKTQGQSNPVSTGKTSQVWSMTQCLIVSLKGKEALKTPRSVEELGHWTRLFAWTSRAERSRGQSADQRLPGAGA